MVTHPAFEGPARAYLDRHPDGRCPGEGNAVAAPPPARRNRHGREQHGCEQHGRERQSRGRSTRPRGFAVCRCGVPAAFVKTLPWRSPRMDRAWEGLGRESERYRDLLTRDDLVFPWLHVRTETAWIRVYPLWPTDLAAYLEDPWGGERLPARGAVRILADLAEALAALEAAGYVHRDLKPANVLVDPGDPFGVAGGGDAPRVALADFGEAGVWGTRWWAAPESFAGAPEATSPIFSLGLVGWVLLARRPFVGFVRDWTRRDRLRWPEDLVRYLSGRPSPFEEDLASAPAHIWRDPGGSDVRGVLLPWIVAATRADPADRAVDLRRLSGGAPDRPAAPVAARLRALI